MFVFSNVDVSCLQVFIQQFWSENPLCTTTREESETNGNRRVALSGVESETWVNSIKNGKTKFFIVDVCHHGNLVFDILFLDSDYGSELDPVMPVMS
jgi:hypothetical protein